MFVPSRGARSAERREFWPPRQARPHANDTSNVTPLSTPRPKRGWTNRPLPSPPPPRRRALTLSLSLRPSPKRRWRRAQARTTTTSRWSPGPRGRGEAAGCSSGLLEQICGKRASVTLRFHGPGGEHANRIGEKRWIRTLLSPPPPHTARLTPPSTLLSVCPLAVEGVSASGRLVAVESSLDEILVEDLRTPTGVLPVARVNMDDVLYVKLPDP